MPVDVPHSGTSFDSNRQEAWAAGEIPLLLLFFQLPGAAGEVIPKQAISSGIKHLAIQWLEGSLNFGALLLVR